MKDPWIRRMGLFRFLLNAIINTNEGGSSL